MCWCCRPCRYGSIWEFGAGCVGVARCLPGSGSSHITGAQADPVGHHAVLHVTWIDEHPMRGEWCEIGLEPGVARVDRHQTMLQNRTAASAAGRPVDSEQVVRDAHVQRAFSRTGDELRQQLDVGARMIVSW